MSPFEINYAQIEANIAAGGQKRIKERSPWHASDYSMTARGRGSSNAGARFVYPAHLTRRAIDDRAREVPI